MSEHTWLNEKIIKFVDDNNTLFEKVDGQSYDYKLTETINGESSVDFCTIEQMKDWDVKLVSVED